MANEPRWLRKARSYVGQKEIAGRQHNPQILQWWTLIRAGFTDDETPWCAGFVGGVLESVDIKSSRSAVARSYLKWGTKLDKPVPGCIVVFQRGTRNGHVAFYIGRDSAGDLLVLGGNQGNAVNISAYPLSRVLGYRWPAGEPLPDAAPAAPMPKPVAVPQSPAPPPPDIEPQAADDAPKGLSAKLQHWLNVGATAAGTFLTALMAGDWRAVAAVASVGLIIFCIIWFTNMRRK